MDNNTIEDWDYAETFYNEDSKNLSLEDFISENETINSTDNQDDAFNSIVGDVMVVRGLYNSGKTIEQISSETGQDIGYIRDIMIILSSISDDDSDIAVAHLVEMS